MNPHFQLMVMMAASADIKDIAKNIKEAAEEVALFGNDEERVSTLRMHCTMFIMHLNCKGTLEGALELIEKIDDHKKKLSLFDLENLS
jgi:hypothetical protein